MALSEQDKKQIEKITQKEIRDFMNSTQVHKMVVKTIQDELGTKKIDDKIIDLSTKVVVELFKTLDRFARISTEKDMDVIGFGNPWQDRNLNGGKYEDIFLDVTPFIPAQSYLITKDKVAKIKQLLETTPWDAIDLWMCNVARLRIGTAEKIYTKHLPGFSIIEQTIKDANTDNPLIFLQ